MGLRFVIYPVLVNCLLMIGIAVAFNVFFGWRRYPAMLGKSAQPADPGGPTHEEIVEALKRIDTFVDVSEEELILLNRLLVQNKVTSPAAAGNGMAAP